MTVSEDDVRPANGLKCVGGERERNWEERKRSSRVLKGWGGLRKLVRCLKGR